MAYLGNNQLPFDPTRTVAAPLDADRFSGDGSTTNFTLSRKVLKAVDIEVFVENVQQEPLTAYDVNGTTLSFTGAPASGTRNIYVVYRNYDTGAQVYVPDGSITYSKLANNIRIFTTDNLTPNGNNSVFTLSEPPADANTVMVTVDGIIQRAPVHYTTSGSTITFTSAPAAGSNVHVRHLGFRTTATVTQLAANSFISQPNIASPTITGTAYFTDKIGIGKNDSSYKLHSYVGSGVNYSITQSAGTTVASAAVFQSVCGNYNSQMFQYGSGESYFITNGTTMAVGTQSTGSLYLISNNTSQMAIDSNGTIYGNSGYGSLGRMYGCRAWVNFNGTGTVAIRASGNVSSITDNGAGDYTVNFTTAMPDTNFSVSGTPSMNNGYNLNGLGLLNVGMNTTTPYVTTSSVRIVVGVVANGVGNDAAATFISVAIHR